MKRMNELLTFKIVFLLCLVLFIGINEIKFIPLCHSDNALSHNSILININEIDNVGDIEIFGNWYGQLPDGDKGDKDITLKITNDEVVMDWVDSTIGDVTSSIIRYDNSAKMAMLQITEHPDTPHQEGMYMKTTWTIVSQNQITVSWYMPQPTEGDAEDDTYPAYGTYTYTRSITSTITTTTTSIPTDSTTSTAISDTTTTSCPPDRVCGDDCCKPFGEERCCNDTHCCDESYECCGETCCNPDWKCVADTFCVPKICLGTEIYGENSDEIKLLRAFRDEVLSQSPLGQEITRLYYEWSPVIVKAIKEDEEFKEEVKELIDGVLELIE